MSRMIGDKSIPFNRAANVCARRVDMSVVHNLTLLCKDATTGVAQRGKHRPARTHTLTHAAQRYVTQRRYRCLPCGCQNRRHTLDAFAAMGVSVDQASSLPYASILRLLKRSRVLQPKGIAHSDARGKTLRKPAAARRVVHRKPFPLERVLCLYDHVPVSANSRAQYRAAMRGMLIGNNHVFPDAGRVLMHTTLKGVIDAIRAYHASLSYTQVRQGRMKYSRALKIGRRSTSRNSNAVGVAFLMSSALLIACGRDRMRDVSHDGFRDVGQPELVPGQL